MEGGCIGVWIKDILDITEKRFLWNYSEMVVKRIKGCFHLNFKTPELNWFERIQIKMQIGYVPKFEIQVCGGLDCIFMAAEMIMRRYNGYYTYGIPKEERKSRNIKGKVYSYYSRDPDDGIFGIHKYYLVSVEVFAAYYNSLEDEETKKLYSFKS